MNKSPKIQGVMRIENVPIWRGLYGTTGAARPATVIPGRASWREPGIHTPGQNLSGRLADDFL
jgi:hypothetical protein